MSRGSVRTDFRVTVLALLAGLVMPPAWAGPPEPDGYRTGDYRAPVPPSLKGARVVTTAEAERLWKGAGAVFLDVMPRVEKPAGLPAGTIWRDKPRSHIPGSAWLPNVGYGALTAETEAYFRQALRELSAGDPARPLLFYCMTDCWMSWNAAKRALTYGYETIIWYPAGADGWEKEGLPVGVANPYGLQAVSQ